jgi:osmoprotectant transport system ATP-binding protein
VIQQIGLMPHMTIRENIVLVPKLLKWSKEKKDAKAKELIKLVDLPEDYFKSFGTSTIFSLIVICGINPIC